MHRPKILLVNDDGVHSGGIWAAYEALSEFAEVIVAAPSTQKSAAGRSITISSPLRINEIQIEGKTAYSVEKQPVDALILGLYALNIKPDLVVSGINIGENISWESVNTSGTIGAAMESANQGVPAIAFSLEIKNQSFKFCDPRSCRIDFSQAKDVVKKTVKYFLKNKFPKGCHVLNVNIPSGKIKGWRQTVLASRLFKTGVEKRTDPHGKDYYWICEKLAAPEEKDSDYYALTNNYVSITPLTMDNTAWSACDAIKDVIDDIKSEK